MKLKIIGSSTSWSDRPASCYSIDDNILIDCGEASSKFFKQNDIDFYNIEHIFITHIHNDHIFGLITFICQAVEYNPVEKYKTLTIYGPKNLKHFLTQLYYVAHGGLEDNFDLEKYINIIEIENYDTQFNINGYNITLQKLKHGELDDIAYIFNNGTTKLGFSGDCTYTPEVETFIEKTDVCLVDCAGEETSANHLGVDKFLELTEKYNDKTIFAVHCNDKVYGKAKQINLKIADSGDIYEF